MIIPEALPPKEAIAFFKQKGFAIGFDHRDVWQAEHQAAFTVAKATQLSVLKNIREMVDKAVSEGITFAQFAKELKPKLVEQGWWGKANRVDPKTGKTERVQLGSRRRLKVVYHTNMRTAHNEGQWQRIQSTKKTFPYLVYDGNNSADPRPDHSSWDGLTLPVDDPFWLAHMPIKQWGCKCRVRQLTQAQVKRRGITVGPAPKVPTRTHTNQRTGKTQQIPAGVDPEFHYPPGGRRSALDDHLVAAIDEADPAVAADSVRSMVADKGFADWLKAPKGNMPVMLLPEAVARAIGAKGRVATLSAQNAAKNAERHPELNLDDYRMLPDIGSQPTVVIRDKGNTVVIIKRGKVWYAAAVKATGTGKGVFVTSLRRTNPADIRTQMRKGEVVFGGWDKK